MEKCLAEFRIDKHTIKRRNFLIGTWDYPVPVNMRLFCICIALSDVVRCMRNLEREREREIYGKLTQVLLF